jgi:hypothetical protein
LGADANCLAETMNCGVALSNLIREPAKKMPCCNVGRIYCENLSIALFCLLQTAGPVLLQRRCQNLRCFHV